MSEPNSMSGNNEMGIQAFFDCRNLFIFYVWDTALPATVNLIIRVLIYFRYFNLNTNKIRIVTEGRNF